MENKEQYIHEWNRKDAQPQDSINRFREILDSINIKTEVVDMKNHKDLWYSCRVVFSELPQIGTNGKGISREYAIASAYGELFERLQSDTLINEYYPCMNFDKDILVSDVKVAAKSLKEFMPHVFGNTAEKEIESMFEKCSKYQSFSQYNCINNGKSVLLPEKILYLLCGTNGISAGNTYEEAFVQGLSEVFERYVMKQLHINKACADTIHTVKDENIKNTKSYKMILAIREKGYECYVKDCTLNGKFPVLGVLVMDRSHTKYCFGLGCDLNIDICLQRCITEIFQGFDFDITFRMQMTSYFENDGNWWSYPIDVKHGLVKSIFDGTGRLPFYLLNNEDYLQGDLLPFENKPMSNIECMEQMMNFIKMNNLTVYTRNCNYLGVPAIRIYIPGYSEAFLYDYSIVDLINSLNVFQSKNKFVLASSDAFSYLSTIINYPPYYNCAPISKICGILHKNNKENRLLNIHYVYACMALKMGEFEKARDNYKKSFTVFYGLKSQLYIDYMNCIIDAIEVGITKDNVKKVLAKGANEMQIAVLVDELYYFANNDLDNIKCEDCDSCMFKNECLYDEWAQIYYKYTKAKKLDSDTYNNFFIDVAKFLNRNDKFGECKVCSRE